MENRHGSFVVDVEERSKGRVEPLWDHVVAHSRDEIRFPRVANAITAVVVGLLLAVLYAGPANALWREMVLERSDSVARFVVIGLCLALTPWRRSTGQAGVDPRGLAGVAAGCVLFLFGRLSADFYTTRLSFVLLLAALVPTFGGFQALRTTAVPLFALAVAIPLPLVVQGQLLAPLRSAAATLASGLLDIGGIRTFREADLLWSTAGSISIASASSDLRLLGPILALAVLFAMRCCRRWMVRLLVILSAIPCAIAVDAAQIAAVVRPAASTGDSFQAFTAVRPVASLFITAAVLWMIARIAGTRA